MLNSKQRAYLRGLGNKIPALYQIGKDGINDNMVKLIEDALEANELIKVHVLENAMISTKEACYELAERTSAEGVQIIGNKFILYKESVNNKQIELPKK